MKTPSISSHRIKSKVKELFLLTCCILLLPSCASGDAPKSGPVTQETATVIKVIDGDTLKVIYKGEKESVRFIGIDTPESRINAKAKKDAARTEQDVRSITAMGKESTRFVKTLVKKDDIVTIEFDVQKRDKYGRLLGYVYLSNGKMLNEEILKAGYANLMTIPPNVKYQEKFLQAYKEARENNRGLWE